MTDIEKLAKSMTYTENMLKLTEEMGELAQAVSKVHWLRTPERRQKVIEEMADVLICMDIVRSLLEIDDGDLKDMYHHKMLRNLQRIGEDIDG